MTVEWTRYKDQDHIICYTFYEPWTLEELNAVDDDVLQAVKDAKETVDVIMDLSHVYTVPRNLVSGGVSRIKRFESSSTSAYRWWCMPSLCLRPSSGWRENSLPITGSFWPTISPRLSRSLRHIALIAPHVSRVRTNLRVSPCRTRYNINQIR